MALPYGKPGIQALGYDPDANILNSDETHICLSRKDVLGIVERAFAEIGGDLSTKVQVKLEVLELVSDGKLAHALLTAIAGAAKLAS